MNPILLSVLMGLTAAAANVLGGAIIVLNHWGCSSMKYLVALLRVSMHPPACIDDFLSRRIPAQDSRGIHVGLVHAGERPKPAQRLGRIHAPGRGHPGGSTDHGVAAPPGEFRVTPIGWGDYLRCSLRPCAGGKPRTGSQDGSAGLLRSRSVFLTRLFRSHTLGKI